MGDAGKQLPRRADHLPRHRAVRHGGIHLRHPLHPRGSRGAARAVRQLRHRLLQLFVHVGAQLRHRERGGGRRAVALQHDAHRLCRVRRRHLLLGRAPADRHRPHRPRRGRHRDHRLHLPLPAAGWPDGRGRGSDPPGKLRRYRGADDRAARRNFRRSRPLRRARRARHRAPRRLYVCRRRHGRPSAERAHRRTRRAPLLRRVRGGIRPPPAFYDAHSADFLARDGSIRPSQYFSFELSGGAL